MSNNPQITERARKKALQSICKIRVAALGFNKAGVCVMTRTNTPTKFGRKGGGRHAERRIMSVARRKGIVRILICRVGDGGVLRPIDPCPQCQAVADKLGIAIDTIHGEPSS